MDILAKNDFKNLMERRDFACVSIYMPTYRTLPEAKHNLIRFKNLLKKMEARLTAAGLRRSDARALSKSAKALAKDLLFWQHQSDGLAAFISSQWFRYYRLPAPFKELLVVTDRFHIKPLLQIYAQDYCFYILALSQNNVGLYRCSRYNISEVKLASVPRSVDESLRYDEPKKQLQFHTKTPGGRGNRVAIFHGHGAGKDEEKNNILRFFKQVDRGLRKILLEGRAPLVLAGVDYLFPIYQDATTYPQLMRQGIPGNPEGLKHEILQKEAWRIVEPYFLKGRGEAAARYMQLAGSQFASNDVETIALAARHGKIDILFTAVGIQRWGIFDSVELSVHLHKKHRPGDEDLLDFAAVQTLLNGGTVYAVKPEEVPGQASMAAIFRY